MSVQLPIWVEYIRALGTPVAAVIFGGIAAWISYRQWKVSAYKYRFELFEKRYHIYSVLQNVYGELLQEDKISGETYSKLAVAANEAQFLFGDDVAKYLREFQERIFEKRRLERKMSRKLSDAEFDKLGEQADQNWKSIDEQMNAAAMLFAKYLKIPE
jgi:hypothetical protein